MCTLVCMHMHTHTSKKVSQKSFQDNAPTVFTLTAMTIPVRGCDPPANSGSGRLLRWQGCVHVVGLWRHFLIVVQVNGSLHVALCTVFMPTVRAADEVLDQQPQGHPNHEQHHQAHNDHHVHLWSCPRQLVWTYTTRSTNSSLQNWGEMQYTVQANSNNNKNPVWYVWVWVSFKSTPHDILWYASQSKHVSLQHHMIYSGTKKVHNDNVPLAPALHLASINCFNRFATNDWGLIEGSHSTHGNDSKGVFLLMLFFFFFFLSFGFVLIPIKKKKKKKKILNII